ncbi:hypothetical protein BJ912DRAFT_954588 [Pholiota molesta]|nr:hypothetical protein BJ912DRAFT_954588 [Pholiota molesta]
MSHLRSIATENVDRIVDLNQRANSNRQRNALVPAVNLPPEILAAIFEFACSPDGEDCIANVDLRSQQKHYRDPPGCSVSACAVTPLFIGAICSAWRSAAWGAPQLWNSITLLYNDHTAKTLAEMLDYWLSKSGALQLSVKYDEPDDEDLDCCPMADTSAKVIGVIAAYAHRLHALNLYLPGRWDLVREVTSCTPLLTRLTIRMSTNAYQADTAIELANAPRLREVTLSGIRLTHFSLPWAQLESLELVGHPGFDDVSELVETLRLCPRLRRFSAPLSNLDWDAPPSALLRHTALETLEVNGYYKKFHPDLFKMLELPRYAPSLRKLVMRDFYNNEFTQRSLDLMNPTKYEGLGREGIRQFDGQGTVDGTGITGPNERGIGTCFVPNLETFEYEGKVNFTSHALAEFLVSRWRGPHVDAPSTRLRSVTFKTTTQIQFEELRLEGMHWNF